MIIKTTTLDNLRPVHKGSLEITKRYQQIKNLLKDGSHILFAEPEYLSAKEIEWKTSLDGELIEYSQSDEKTQEIIRIQLKEQVNKVFNNELIKDDQDIIDYLNLVLEIPNLDNIYYINDTVVICNWGYIEDRHNAERSIIRKLINDVLCVVNFEDEEGVIVPGLPVRITYGKNTKEYITDGNGQLVLDVIYGSAVYIDIDLKNNNFYQENHIQKSIQCLGEKTEATIVLKLAETVTPPPTISWFSKHKKKILAIVSLLLLLLGALLLMLNLKQNITITVYDKSTNEVIERANIAITYFKDNEKQVKSNETNRQGQFSEQFPSSLKKVSLTAKKTGYHDYGATIDIKKKEIKIYLDRLSAKNITITVYDKGTHRTIRNASIGLSYQKNGNTKTKQLLADNNGKVSVSLPYSLEKLSIKVGKTGYHQYANTDLIVKKEIKIYLSKINKKEIIIEVYDRKTKKPIKGAEVRIVSGSSYTTDSNGRVILSIPEGNTVTVMARAAGYYDDGQSKKTITATSGSDNKFYLKKKVTLKGRSGDPRINITWNKAVDIDLILIDPCGNKIYFSNANKSSGKGPIVCRQKAGILDVDALSSCGGDIRKCQENITWTAGGAAGTYKVIVDHYSSKRLKTDIELTIVNNGRIEKKKFSLTNHHEEYKHSFQH